MTLPARGYSPVFTGIVETIGTIEGVTPFPGGKRFTVSAAFAAAAADDRARLTGGASVAFNGVCLTAETINFDKGCFTVSAVEETLRRTSAGSWRRGSQVHLERALPADGRFDGHIVQGHVDGTGAVVKAGLEGREFVLAVQIPEALRRYVVAKGSLAVNGVSLTVGLLNRGLCRLFIIPETLERTLIGSYRAGEKVNLEVDLIAKYVESLLGRK
jgi:riboflavin synthase